MTEHDWLISSLLFAIGVLLILGTVLGWLLMEARRSKAQAFVTLETSIARHKASLREHREECVEIENRHKAALEKLSRAHKQELNDMLEILGDDRENGKNRTLSVRPVRLRP